MEHSANRVIKGVIMRTGAIQFDAFASQESESYSKKNDGYIQAKLKYKDL